MYSDSVGWKRKMSSGKGSKVMTNSFETHHNVVKERSVDDLAKTNQAMTIGALEDCC